MLIRGASSTLVVHLLPLSFEFPCLVPLLIPLLVHLLVPLLVNPGGPPPPSWFEFPCLVPVSLLPPALTCTLQPPAASALVRIPCLYPSPLEHGSRQWGDRHNSIPLLLLSLWSSMSPASHTQTFPWPFKQWPIWGQLQVAPRLQYHALEIGNISRSCSWDIPTVFFHVL